MSERVKESLQTEREREIVNGWKLELVLDWGIALRDEEMEAIEIDGGRGESRRRDRGSLR